MTNFESHEKRGRGYGRILLQFIATIVVLSVIGGFLSFDHASLGITEFYAGVARLILLVVGVVTILALVQGPLRNRMQMREGAHFASAFSFFATLITLILAFLALLATLSIPTSSFLVAVGGIGIVIGFAISTVTTNIISGAFMLTSFPIKIGQRIIITVNNQPGTITSISTLFMTVTTDAGARLIIPNAAIFQGMAFMLDVSQAGRETTDSETLLGRPGDRVITTLYPYPATVKEVTRLTTKIVTDGGQMLTIPNQAILNGSSALVKIQTPEGGISTLPVAVGDEVRLSAGDFAGKVTEVGPYYFRVSNDEEEVLVPIASLASGGITVFKKRGATTEIHKPGA
jgi:hypothetical protein